MSLSVKDCLQIGDLKFAKVVAGTNGIDRVVKNITVAETFEAPYDLLNGNELVITAFYSIKNDVKKQYEVITKLNNQNVSGLIIFYLGVFLKKLDSKIIELANNLNFPLIIMPENRVDLAYADVIKPVITTILKVENQGRNVQDFDMLNNIINITNSLSHKNENNKVLEEALKEIYKLTKSSLILVDTFFESQAYYLDSEIIQNNIEVICEYCKIAYANETENNNILNIQLKIKTIIKPFDIYIIPIDIKYKNYGFLIVISDDKNPIDKTTLDQVEKLLKVILNIWKCKLANMSEIEHVSKFIKGKCSKIELFNYQVDQTFNFQEINCLILIKLLEKDVKELNISKILNFIKIQLDSLNLTNFITVEKNNIIILSNYYNINNDNNGNLLLAELSNIIIKNLYRKFDVSSIIGISHNIYDLELINQHYVNLDNNLTCAKIIYPWKKIFFDEDFVLPEMSLNIINNSKEYSKKLMELVEPLKYYDKKNNTEFFLTLETLLLNHNNSLKSIANKLYIHENTLKYRINRIGEILGFNPCEDPKRLEATLAIAITKISSCYSNLCLV